MLTKGYLPQSPLPLSEPYNLISMDRKDKMKPPMQQPRKCLAWEFITRRCPGSDFHAYLHAERMNPQTGQRNVARLGVAVCQVHKECGRQAYTSSDCSRLPSLHTSCRKSSTLPHNSIDYLLYDEEGRTFQLHDTFPDIFGDNDCSVSDTVALLYSTGLSKTV
jgi:hypothetical protein